MKRVKLSDQLVSSYSTARTNNKWCQNVFYHLLDMVAVNTYVVHTVLGGTLSQFVFHLELIANLLHQPPTYERKGHLWKPLAIVS